MKVFVVLLVLDNAVDNASLLKVECVTSNVDDILPKLAASYPGGEVRRTKPASRENLHYTLYLDGKETDFVFLVEEFDI